MSIFPSIDAYKVAAARLGCDLNSIRAVARVEAGPQGAFYPNGEPVILYERHLFSRYTSRKYDGARINNLPWGVLSDREEGPGSYGPSGIQHQKLAAAVKLDRDAALRACSWGLFQILGNNHVLCGHPDVQGFVNAAYRSVDDHLGMFVSFVMGDPMLLQALRNHNWTRFASIYNGPRYAINNYDKKMTQAYASLEAAGTDVIGG